MRFWVLSPVCALIVTVLGQSAFCDNQDIYRAIFDDNIELMKELVIEQKVDVNQPDPFGDTFLMHAVRNGRLAAASWLIGQGASPNISHQFGRTVLHEAARRNDVAMVRILVNSSNAGRDLIDIFGDRPYDFALRLRSAELASLLRPEENEVLLDWAIRELTPPRYLIFDHFDVRFPMSILESYRLTMVAEDRAEFDVIFEGGHRKTFRLLFSEEGELLDIQPEPLEVRRRHVWRTSENSSMPISDLFHAQSWQRVSFDGLMNL